MQAFYSQALAQLHHHDEASERNYLGKESIMTSIVVIAVYGVIAVIGAFTLFTCVRAPSALKGAREYHRSSKFHTLML